MKSSNCFEKLVSERFSFAIEATGATGKQKPLGMFTINLTQDNTVAVGVEKSGIILSYGHCLCI